MSFNITIFFYLHDRLVHGLNTFYLHDRLVHGLNTFYLHDRLVHVLNTFLDIQPRGVHCPNLYCIKV